MEGVGAMSIADAVFLTMGMLAAFVFGFIAGCAAVWYARRERTGEGPLGRTGAP